MVYKFERLIIGLILILIVSISYYLKLEFLLTSIISLLVLYELYINKFYTKFNLTLTFFLFFLFLILVIKFNLSFIYIKFLILIFIILTLLFKKLIDLLFLPIIFIFLLLLINTININSSYFYILIIISFLNDTIAYLVGKTFKGPLIAPTVSPNKTWSGTLSSSLITYFVLISLNFHFFYSIFLSISLFFGDLYFSHIKRYKNIKDYSNILFSHGGILDRLDSFLFIILFLNIYNLII